MTIRKLVQQAATGAAVIAATAALPGSANAAPITGFLGIGGGITYDSVGTSGSAILDWSPSGGGTGNAFVVTQASGYFNPGPVADPGGLMGIDPGTRLLIRDLTNDPALAGANAALALPGAGNNVTNFLTGFVDPDGVLAPVTGLHFDLTELVVQTPTADVQPCNFTETSGSCILGDIFVLTQTTEGLRINLDVRGFFRANGDADSGFFKGAFSTTFTDMEFQEAYAKLSAGQNLDCPSNDGQGGRVPCSFDASFTNAQPIPEPASLLLFGTGSTLLAIRRRRAKK